MKRETLRHPKTYDLCARLGRSRPEVLGFLTLLWDFTAEASTEGSVGRWPNGAIARACDWTDDPDVFVSALVASGWLDEDPVHRLLVHDWSDHCERWIRAKLDKLGKKFAVKTTTEASTEPPVEATTEPSPPRDQTKPNQTKPITPKSPSGDLNGKQPRKRRDKSIIPYPPDFLRFWEQYPQHRRDGKDCAANAHRDAVARIVVNHPKFDQAQAAEWLLQKTIQFAASPAGNNGKFTPHPATWLNQGRYESDPSAWDSAQGEPEALPLWNEPDPAKIVPKAPYADEVLAKRRAEREAREKAKREGEPA